MQQWHLDDECEQVINDGVEELVGHLPPWQMGHTLQLVVQVQLKQPTGSPSGSSNRRLGMHAHVSAQKLTPGFQT
jgi:hypothetical protein